MIRKNDSITYIGKWGKTITPKINWHLSRRAVPNYENERKRVKSLMHKTSKKRWGTNKIGIKRNFNLYMSVIATEYDALKKIKRMIKRNFDKNGTLWSNKITYNHNIKEEEWKRMKKLANDVGKKYGFVLKDNEEYEKYFKWIELTKIRDVKIYPYYS